MTISLSIGTVEDVDYLNAAAVEEDVDAESASSTSCNLLRLCFFSSSMTFSRLMSLILLQGTPSTNASIFVLYISRTSLTQLDMGYSIAEMLGFKSFGVHDIRSRVMEQGICKAVYVSIKPLSLYTYVKPRTRLLQR